MRRIIKKIFNWIFPCGFNEPLCKDNLWGCRCGKNFFSSKKESTGVDIAADPYKKVREELVGYLTGPTGIGKPAEQYGGELVAPMSKQEEESLDWLGKYTAGGPAETRTAGAEEIKKTLTGQYDPSTSPYYQAVKAEAARNLEESQKNIADITGGKGLYYTGARVSEQGKTARDVAIGLNKVLGGLAETERGRMMQALPFASEFATAEEEAPLRKAAALQEMGGMPRILQQVLNEALYNEWIRATQEWPLNIAQLGAGVQQPPLYKTGGEGYQPSIFTNLASIASNIFK